MTDPQTNTPDVERLDLESMDIAAERIERLREDFPEVFREGAIDFDALRRSLGEWVDPGKERFGLTWPGKANCMRVIQQPSTGTLVPDRSESVDFDTTQNVIIEGENLEVLKLLQKSYYGKVKMIYIDPPYNTGNDFIYPDDYRDGLKDYLSYSGQTDGSGSRISTNTDTEGRYHSNWLNMMFPRLYLARILLREDGVIFVSIDDTEVSNLRQLMNMVFGEENFVANIVWEKKFAPQNDARYLSDNHDHVILFARDKGQFKRNLLPRTEESNLRYQNPDNDPRGPWASGDLLRMEHRSNSIYSIVAPNGTTWTPEPGTSWRHPEDEMTGLIEDNQIYFGVNGGSKPRRKKFLRDVRQGLVPETIWTHEFVGHNQEGTQIFKRLFRDCSVEFTNPKPPRLIEQMNLISTSPNSDDIILDFFAGSGSTGHAILNLNSVSRGNRRFILVQLPEPTNGDLPTISAITRERVRRAGKAMFTERSSKLDLDGHGQLDLGFRAYRLSESNFVPWHRNASDNTTIAQQIAFFADNVLPGRTPEDILTEILLKSGYELTVPVTRLELAGKEVFSVAEGALLVCLDRALTIETIEAMAALGPGQIVCLDVGFGGDDALKVNAVQTVKGRDNAHTVFKVV